MKKEERLKRTRIIIEGDKMVEKEWHKKARKEIIERYENKGYVVESSHEDKRIRLSRGKLSSDTFLSDADVVLIKDDKIVKVVEIQSTDTPKELVGIIKTTDLCDQCKIDDEVYDLSDIELIIAMEKPEPNSKKPQQLKLIKDNLKVDGCLKDFNFEEIQDC